MAALVSHVALFDEKGFLQQFGPGDVPPAWARKKLTNPKLWDTPPAEEDESGQGGGSEGNPSGGGDEPPPLAGPGSGRDPWATYAAKHGVAVTEDDKRDEIVAKLREAGVRVE
ncbi:hypothetical protein [Mycolicibacterium mageritense]|uniref:Uncharacterized protein n=1 Tax=Mycolicibacterium mageritense TaxID=53462 RepID=A0AAI8XSM4_MYCME|nr:hypothetical protein [Mycolicibacterium mageritense]BDY33163.1 hypothetical protein hbim_07138 [Mycolicibacterium mageritense]